MGTSKVLSIVFFVLLGVGICSAARTLLTIGGGVHGEIGVGVGVGGYGGGGGSGGGGGYGGAGGHGVGSDGGEEGNKTTPL